MVIIDFRQEEIQQEDDNAKAGQQGSMPVGKMKTAVRVALHPGLSGKRLKAHLLNYLSIVA